MPGEDGEPQGTVKYAYIKSSQFRTISLDGVFGGPTPRGKLLVAAFSERYSIPEQTTHLVEGGVIGKEIVEDRISREAIIRELEACLVMDLEAAKTLRDWLIRHVSVLEAMLTREEKGSSDVEA